MSDSIQSEQHTLAYGDTAISYSLAYADRKTLAIRVQPDLLVSVVAPVGTPLEAIEARLLRRAAWITRKQRQYARYLPHLPPRQYVSGETHRYLGRQFRLKVIEGSPESVDIDRLYITIVCLKKSDHLAIQRQMDAWYRIWAEINFAERLRFCFPRVEHLGVHYPRLLLRGMTTRWGSTSPNGRITLNLKLIQVPKPYIDYVVLHELCHLREPHHGQAFYRLLDRVLPDWRERRDGLNGYQFG